MNKRKYAARLRDAEKHAAWYRKWTPENAQTE